MKNIWVIGAGRFGQKAAKVLHGKLQGAEITVVDHSNSICRALDATSFRIICMDGIAYLAKFLKKTDIPAWIVPALPVHLAYEWIKMKITPPDRLKPMAVPGQLAMMLPNMVRGGEGELYISNADFICPENCPEPEQICTFTGQPRPRILHQVLASIQYNNFRSVVVTSQQLSPGVGGYSPHALFKALEEVTTSSEPVLLSTACCCHGVMHALEMERV